MLFRRNKRCLNCNSKVTRKIEKTDIKSDWGVERQGHSIEIGEKHKHKIIVKYVCDTCGNSFLPREFW